MPDIVQKHTIIERDMRLAHLHEKKICQLVYRQFMGRLTQQHLILETDKNAN